MGLIILAGILGALGSGPLAHRRVQQGSIVLDYDRLVRSNAPTTLELTIEPTSPDRRVRVWLRQDYLGSVQLQHVVPQPVQSYSDSGRLVLEFVAGPGGGPSTIMLELEPDRIGNYQAALGSGSDSISFQQFVLP